MILYLARCQVLSSPRRLFSVILTSWRKNIVMPFVLYFFHSKLLKWDLAKLYNSWTKCFCKFLIKYGHNSKIKNKKNLFCYKRWLSNIEWHFAWQNNNILNHLWSCYLQRNQSCHYHFLFLAFTTIIEML